MSSKSVGHVRKLTPEQKEDIRSIFHQLDEDRDGLICFEDVISVLHILRQNPTEEEIADITKRHSKGTNERLSLDEVYKVLHRVGLKSTEEVNDEMIQAFRTIDKSGDGYISKIELRNFLTKHNQDIVKEDEYDAILMSADVNKDGKIDYKEFVNFLMTL